MKVITVRFPSFSSFHSISFWQQLQGTATSCSGFVLYFQGWFACTEWWWWQWNQTKTLETTETLAVECRAMSSGVVSVPLSGAFVHWASLHWMESKIDAGFIFTGWPCQQRITVCDTRRLNTQAHHIHSWLFLPTLVAASAACHCDKESGYITWLECDYIYMWLYRGYNLM